MIERLSDLVRNLGWRIHGFAIGLSLVWGGTLLGQGCAAGGG
jgi:hypothetical protein